MKCSAVRKDFWCLTNKVNQIINKSRSSLTRCTPSPDWEEQLLWASNILLSFFCFCWQDGRIVASWLSQGMSVNLQTENFAININNNQSLAWLAAALLTPQKVTKKKLLQGKWGFSGMPHCEGNPRVDPGHVSSLGWPGTTLVPPQRAWGLREGGLIISVQARDWIRTNRGMDWLLGNMHVVIRWIPLLFQVCRCSNTDS